MAKRRNEISARRVASLFGDVILQSPKCQRAEDKNPPYLRSQERQRKPITDWKRGGSFSIYHLTFLSCHLKEIRTPQWVEQAGASWFPSSHQLKNVR